ncbi:DUF481 domain-containing protein [Vibrio fluvialis]|nr:DUF481 domain-containing protein [Vibrio fluvialis]
MSAKGNTIAAVVLFCVGSTGAFSAPQEPDSGKSTSKLSGDAKLGFIFSKTDSTSMSVNSGATLKYDEAQRKQQLSLATYYSHQSDDDGTNKYRIIYDIKHSVTDDMFWFSNAKYEHDQFATYRHQALIVAGLGKTLIDDETSKLEMGAGPGFRYSKRQSYDKTRPNESQDDVIANAFVNGNTQLTAAMNVGGGLRVDYGDSNTTTTANAFLKNKLAEKLALVLDTEYIYNSQVAAGKSHDEIYSTLSLNYAF